MYDGVSLMFMILERSTNYTSFIVVNMGVTFSYYSYYIAWKEHYYKYMYTIWELYEKGYVAIIRTNNIAK